MVKFYVEGVKTDGTNRRYSQIYTIEHIVQYGTVSYEEYKKAARKEARRLCKDNSAKYKTMSACLH